MDNPTIPTRSNTWLALLLLELLVLLALPLPVFNLGFIYITAGIVITVVIKFIRKEQWRQYGFYKPVGKTILLAILIGIGLGIVDNYFIEPLLTKLLGEAPDLSAFKALKGNIQPTLILLAIGWLIGGFFEEYFFRGYLTHRFSTLIKDPLLCKLITIIIVSIVFSLAHSYQGFAGIFATFYFSVIMGLLYYYFGKNVWYLILIHGFYDTVGIFKLYLGQ